MTDIPGFETDRSRSLDSPAETHYQIVAGPDDLSPRPRAIRCETPGTIWLTDIKGTSLPYTMAQGSWEAFRGKKATLITGGGVFYAEL